MKNCPKCGTIITDNNVVCDNCGADLVLFNKTDGYSDDGFADNFFAQIGGVVSVEQETVIDEQGVNFNANQISNSKNIQKQNVFVSDNDKNNENGEGFNSVLNSYISSENRDFNSDMKSSKSKFFNFETTNENNDTLDEKKNDLSEVTMAYDSQIPKRVDVDPVKIDPIPYTPPVIRDDDEYVPPLHSMQNQVMNQNQIMQQPLMQEIANNQNIGQGQQVVVVKEAKKFSFAWIVNLLGLIVFAGSVLFVVNRLKTPAEEHTVLGGLTYVLDDAFNLKSDSEGSKYYVYKSGCEIRATYGSANSDSFLDSYFNSIRENFKGEEYFTFQNDVIKINNNSWTNLSVMELPNGSLTSTTLRYKYSSIVHNGNFYHIVFVNINDDSECLSMYNNFVNTLKFQ